MDKEKLINEMTEDLDYETAVMIASDLAELERLITGDPELPSRITSFARDLLVHTKPTPHTALSFLKSLPVLLNKQAGRVLALLLHEADADLLDAISATAPEEMSAFIRTLVARFAPLLQACENPEAVSSVDVSLPLQQNSEPQIVYKFSRMDGSTFTVACPAEKATRLLIIPSIEFLTLLAKKHLSEDVLDSFRKIVSELQKSVKEERTKGQLH